MLERNTDYSKLQIQTYNNDTTYLQTIWIKVLNDTYTYLIPENEKVAIIELNAYNLFSDAEPNYSFMAKGNILFDKNRRFYYYSYNNFRDYSYSGLDVGLLNYSYIGYKTNYSDTRIGSVQGNYQQSIYGIGLDASFDYNKNKLKATYLKGIYYENTSYGASLNIKLGRIHLNTGAVVTNNPTYNIDTRLAFAGPSFNFLKYNSFSFIFGVSELQGNASDIRQGYGLDISYILRFKKLYINAKAKYGSQYYTGIYGGRTDIRAYLDYYFSKKSTLKLSYEKYEDSYFNFLQYNVNNRYNLLDRTQISYNRTVNKNIFYQIGLSSRFESTKGLYSSNPDSLFNITMPGFFSLVNVHIDKLTFEPRLEIFRLYELKNSEALRYNQGVNALNISFNIQTKNVGLYSLFKYGPNSIYEHFIYLQDKVVTKWFFLMPFYKKSFFEDKVLLDLRANFINNLNNSERTFNLNTQLFWYLPNDFSVRLLNTFYSRSRIDLNTNIKYSYSNIYFEIGLRKEFNVNQPKVKYYDLKVIFYKDINGNREKDSNEPGISNVLATIVHDFTDSTENIRNFNEIQFLSNATGGIEYNNIPSGPYILKYQLLNEIVGNFSLEQLQHYFTMEQDKTIYIPYLENNRIIGKVILNRDPLSALGNIDISNIRITAEDTKGHSYSALTDKNGNFILYTPVADYYTVKVNNVFYESFDLQQPEYIVKFNGYKQFEVTFIFNEKKRKINFDNQITEEPDIEDIQLIRKTTLTGKIRDAISLEPIEAEIKIIDNKTNKEVSRAVSNKITGNYSISYVAGTHYRMEVVAKGYWEHVENLYIEQVISIQNINKDIMLNKLGENPEEQKTYIIYKKEEEFTENFKQGQQIPINYLNFDLKQTRLNPEAYPELDRLIELLNKNKAVNIEIAGYSDDQSNSRVEKIIALRRAKAVAKYLTMHGLNENRIIVKSYGNTRPLVPGANEKARKKNRRVEIIVQ